MNYPIQLVGAVCSSVRVTQRTEWFFLEITDSDRFSEVVEITCGDDVCQKVALLGNDGLFGFAGPVKEAAVTAEWITGTYKKLGARWLGVESEVIGMLRHIGALGQLKRNSFLVAYMDERARATLVRFSTDGDYAVTRLGLEMIGSGSEAYEEINSERIKLMEFGGLGEGGIAVAHRALFMSQMIFDVARDLSITSVGGLMQVHFVERGGALIGGECAQINIQQDCVT